MAHAEPVRAASLGLLFGEEQEIAEGESKSGVGVAHALELTETSSGVAVSALALALKKGDDVAAPAPLAVGAATLAVLA